MTEEKVKPKPQNYDVLIRVVDIKGKCESGYKVGDEILYSRKRIKGKVCLSALSSMMGSIYAVNTGARFSHSKDPTKTKWGCPDYHNLVIFEIMPISREKQT